MPWFEMRSQERASAEDTRVTVTDTQTVEHEAKPVRAEVKALPRFMPEVQALRALAVMLVLLYHVSRGRLPTGGYIGVDVFFVVSGFLITGHLWREAEARGRVSIRRFYGRRARRLLPAASCVLVLTLLGVYLWVPQTQWVEFGWQLLASAFYGENWALALNAVDYAAPGANTSPVQHFWSLAVEEQFYLAWPWLIVTAAVISYRRGRQRLTTAAVLGLVTVLSLAASLWMTAADPAFAYFATPARAWEFGAGGLAVFVRQHVQQGRTSTRVALQWLGVFLILGSAGALDAGSPFPGWLALVPVAGTSAVLLAGDVRGPVSLAAPVSWRPVQWVGDISYSLYLWHWPLLILLPFALGTGLSLAERLLVLPVSLVIAHLSKKYVEDFFRADQPRPDANPGGVGRRPLRLHRNGFVVAGAGCLVICLGASLMVQTASAKITAAEGALAAALADPPRCFGAAAVPPAGQSCPDSVGGATYPAPVIAENDAFGATPAGKQCFAQGRDRHSQPCRFDPSGTGTSTRAALIGDSHAAQWEPALEQIAMRQHWSLSVFTKSGCPLSDVPPASAAARFGDACEAWNADVQQQVATGHFNLVFVSGLSGQRYATASGHSAVSGLESSWRQITSTGAEVVALRDNPNPSRSGVPDIPTCVAAHADYRQCATPVAQAVQVDPQVEASAHTDVKLLDLNRYFCVDGRCPAVIGQVIVYRGQQHVTSTYMRTLAPYLEQELRAVNVLP
jgi:peptidoglycan/LPS O-acetylase OafA/YrhL